MNINDFYSSPLDKDFTRFSTMWEMLLDEWERLATEVPDAKHAYEMAYAEAIKKAEGTVKEKEAEATIKTGPTYLTLLKTEARLEFIKAKLRWMDKEMSILQTRAANARAEWQHAGMPEPTRR
jgi:hypothetical protein